MTRKFTALLCVFGLLFGLFACGDLLSETPSLDTGTEPGQSSVTTEAEDTEGSTEPDESHCNHSWQEADCLNPKTCLLCGATEGEAIAHSWQSATCLAPKTCSACGVTEGEPGEHLWNTATCKVPQTCTICDYSDGQLGDHNWQNASCSSPKTCTVCGMTEGEALSHSWKDANCTAPKTCSLCNATEGSAAGHQWKAADCSTPKTCSSCGATEGEPEHNYSNGYCTRCNKADPDATFVWIPTNGGTRYHCKFSCSGMIDPEMVTVEEAVARGFTPCGRCY